MIISKTPFRISFFGGGTDYPVWYRENTGSVLSTTINKYCYISTRYLPPFFDYKYRIRYRRREETQTFEEIRHPAVRECLKFLNIKDGIEMVHTSDLPALSGIGSSSSFTVGFLNSLYALTGRMISKRQLALDAIHIEQDIIKENVGSQDQTAAAFGGFNRIDFGGEEEIQVHPITISKEKLDLLQDHLLMFFTGFSRIASNIAAEQIKQTPAKAAELKAMTEILEEAIEVLNAGPERLAEFGKLLHETWKIKKGLTNLISNSEIDAIYEVGIEAGAIGGKLCGAGGGGFMVFFAPPEAHARIKERLKNLLYVPFRFETSGSQILFSDPQEPFPEPMPGLFIKNKNLLISRAIKDSIEAKEDSLENNQFLPTIEKIVDEMTNAFRNGKRVFFCGNGGSAADAQHLAAELSGKFYLDREPLPAQALHTNTSFLTAVANDYSYEEVFARAVKGEGKEGDVLVGISTSGNSANVVRALETANNLKMITVGLSGQGGGKMKDLCQYLIEVPSADTPRIQESHILIGHIICELVEKNLFGS